MNFEKYQKIHENSAEGNVEREQIEKEVIDNTAIDLDLKRAIVSIIERYETILTNQTVSIPWWQVYYRNYDEVKPECTVIGNQIND